MTEKDLDDIVSRFILFDIGQLRGEEAMRARDDFSRLDTKAIPALVRGLNRAANLQASCPIQVIASLLKTLVSLTDDVRILDYGVKTIGTGVTWQNHVTRLRTVREDFVRRQLAVVQGKITLRDVAVRQLYRANAAAVKKALKHDNADVRWAAARIVASRGLRLCDELIDLLTDADIDVCQAAHQALMRVACGNDFGPGLDADENARAGAAAQWRTWLEADRLRAEMASATEARRGELLGKIQEGKGLGYTQVLAEVIAGLPEGKRARARQALAERLTRMTIPTLRDKLKDENPEIRRAAALACAMREEMRTIPDVIALLDDSEPLVTRAARAALKSLAGQDFGPAANASRAERKEAVRQWREWWAKQDSGKR